MMMKDKMKTQRILSVFRECWWVQGAVNLHIAVERGEKPEQKWLVIKNANIFDFFCVRSVRNRLRWCFCVGKLKKWNLMRFFYDFLCVLFCFFGEFLFRIILVFERISEWCCWKQNSCFFFCADSRTFTYSNSNCMMIINLWPFDDDAINNSTFY